MIKAHIIYFLCYLLYLHILNFTDILVDSAVFFQALLQEDSSANYEAESVSYSANDPVEATQDDYVPQALNKEEQTGLHCSGHSGKLLIASATYIDKNDKGTYNLFLCYLLCLHILNFHRYSGRFCCFL